MRESTERLAFRDTPEGRAQVEKVAGKIRATLDEAHAPVVDLPAPDRTNALIDRLRARLKEKP